MENSRAPFIFLSGQGLTYLNRHFTWNSWETCFITLYKGYRSKSLCYSVMGQWSI
jgi:hypothetical protein